MNQLSEKKNGVEEEKHGSKIIKWTPFPTPPKNNVDYSKVDQASIRMTLFKIYPVYNPS